MDWEVEDKEDQKVPIVDEDIAQYILNRIILPRLRTVCLTRVSINVAAKSSLSFPDLILR